MNSRNKALTLEPNNINALLIRGNSYRLTKRFDESLKDLNRVLTLNPVGMNKFSIFKLLGATYVDKKDYNKALEYFNKTLELGVNNAEVLALRGETYRLMGYFTNASKDLTAALGIEPNNPVITRMYQRLIATQRTSQSEHDTSGFRQRISP